MLAVTSTTILTVVVVAAVALAGGLVHVLIRAGRDGERLAHVEHELRDVKDDVRELFGRLTGYAAPSVRRDREESGPRGPSLSS